MEETDLIEILNYLKTRILFIITIVLLFVAMGIIYVKQNNKYVYAAESTLTIFSVRTNTNDLYVDNTIVNTYLNVINSRKVLEHVIEDLNLNLTFESLKNSVSIIPQENSAFVSVKVTMSKNKTAVEIVNNIVSYFATNIDSLVEDNNIKVNIIDSAKEAKKVYSISVKKIMFLFLLLGVVLGVGLVLIRFYFDNRIKSIKRISNDFNLKIMGIIHKTTNNKLINEDYGILKNNLLYNKCNLKSILVTSSLSLEDKETVCFNLSKEFANNNEKVLLIDFDLYNNRISECFKNIDNVDYNKFNNKDILSTESNNVYVLNYKSDKLDYKKIEKELKELEKDYDRIIINGLPLCGFGDSLFLSKIVEGVLLVCKINCTKFDDLKESKTILENISSNIVGVVVTNVKYSKKFEKNSFK